MLSILTFQCPLCFLLSYGLYCTQVPTQSHPVSHLWGLIGVSASLYGKEFQAWVFLFHTHSGSWISSVSLIWLLDWQQLRTQSFPICTGDRGLHFRVVDQCSGLKHDLDHQKFCLVTESINDASGYKKAKSSGAGIFLEDGGPTPATSWRHRINCKPCTCMS